MKHKILSAILVLLSLITSANEYRDAEKRLILDLPDNYKVEKVEGTDIFLRITSPEGKVVTIGTIINKKEDEHKANSTISYSFKCSYARDIDTKLFRTGTLISSDNNIFTSSTVKNYDMGNGYSSRAINLYSHKYIYSFYEIAKDGDFSMLEKVRDGFKSLQIGGLYNFELQVIDKIRGENPNFLQKALSLIIEVLILMLAFMIAMIAIGPSYMTYIWSKEKKRWSSAISLILSIIVLCIGISLISYRPILEWIWGFGPFSEILNAPMRYLVFGN